VLFWYRSLKPLTSKFLYLEAVPYLAYLGEKTSITSMGGSVFVNGRMIAFTSLLDKEMLHIVKV
jgi:hypothetical protein